MNNIMTQLLNPFFYWLAWIIIPLIVEVIPSIGSFFVLLHQKHKHKKLTEPAIWPDIVLIIPVYNSENSLEACLESVELGHEGLTELHHLIVALASDREI